MKIGEVPIESLKQSVIVPSTPIKETREKIFRAFGMLLLFSVKL